MTKPWRVKSQVDPLREGQGTDWGTDLRTGNHMPLTSRLFASFCLLTALSCAADASQASKTSRGGGAGSGSSSTVPAAGAANSSNPNNTNPSLGTLVPVAGSLATTAPGTAADGGANTCARGMQIADPVTPTVWLIVDGSSSMNMNFDAGRSRWQTLRSTLMDPGGVVDSLQAAVRFGMVIYSGGSSDPAECVQLVTVNPALNNLQTLSAQYPMQPLGMGTPTDKALDHVVKDLPVVNGPMLDTKSGPIYVVLATDGQPNDNCGGGGIIGIGGGGGGNVEQRVIDITTNGTKMGMQMFVISLAGDDMRLQNHLSQVAAATASKTPPYVPSTQNDLIAAFRKIVGGATCQVALDGMVKPGAECTGNVRLNTTELKCNDADGWKLSDPRTVQLTGAACMSFLSSQSVIFADFPCEAFAPQ